MSDRAIAGGTKMRIVSYKGHASERSADSDYGSALSDSYKQELKEQIAREDAEMERLLAERYGQAQTLTVWEQVKQNLPEGNCDNPHHDLDDDGTAEYRYTGNGRSALGEKVCQACLDNVTDGPTDRLWEVYEVIR